MCEKAKIIEIQQVINEWRNSENEPNSIPALNSCIRKIENIIRPYDENDPIVQTKSLGPKAIEN